MTANETDDLMKPREVALAFRVTPHAVTRWANAGKLTCVRTPGGHRRYKRAEVLALLAWDAEVARDDA